MDNRPNILIATVQVPYTRGGAELLVDGLRRELGKRDFVVDVVQIPFSAQPKEEILRQIALWRSLDLRAFSGRNVDLVICVKFPAYMVNHRLKSLWLIHQHRQIYDLYNSRFGDFDESVNDEALRQMVTNADRKALEECAVRFTISPNVTARLERFLGLESSVLMPPLPLGSRYFNSSPEPYILSVGRLCSIKRVDLLIKALPKINEEISLKIVGVSDEPAIDAYLKSEIEKHHLWHRVQFLGRVDDEMLLNLFAKSLAVYYAPYDEDYGFVTLEALASGKPVITASDSGGVLEFVHDGDNGLVVEPNEQAMADACNLLYKDQDLYKKLVLGTKVATQAIPNWDTIVRSLTAPLNQSLKHAALNPKAVIPNYEDDPLTKALSISRSI